MRFFIGLKKRIFGENGIFHEDFLFSGNCRAVAGISAKPAVNSPVITFL
jgi:hypothetical protein